MNVMTKNAKVTAGLIAMQPVMWVLIAAVAKQFGTAYITDSFRYVNGKSYHRLGLALDFRVPRVGWHNREGTKWTALDDGKNLTSFQVTESAVWEAVDRVKANCPGFDIIWEDANKPNSHLHGEFDPRVST